MYNSTCIYIPILLTFNIEHFQWPFYPSGCNNNNKIKPCQVIYCFICTTWNAAATRNRSEVRDVN